MSDRTLEEYLSRLTSRHRDKPKFRAMLTLALQPLVDAQNLQAELSSYYFDIDSAIGVQLDAVGVRVGVSRDVRVPIVDVYFSFEDALRGWDRGVWKGPYDTDYGIVRLDDDTYRRVLYVRSAANAWDGTVEEAQQLLTRFFDDSRVLVMYLESAQSNVLGKTAASAQPSVTIAVAGRLPPLALMYLLTQNVVPLRPNGVSLDYSFTSVNDTPLFGFDVQNDHISGWDGGSWGVDADYVASHVAVGS